MAEYLDVRVYGGSGGKNWGSNGGGGTSYTFGVGFDMPFAGLHYDNTPPKSAYLRCTHCGTRSMIPQSVDRITPLVCPQCGGKLDD